MSVLTTEHAVAVSHYVHERFSMQTRTVVSNLLARHRYCATAVYP